MHRSGVLDATRTKSQSTGDLILGTRVFTYRGAEACGAEKLPPELAPKKKPAKRSAKI